MHTLVNDRYNMIDRYNREVVPILLLKGFVRDDLAEDLILTRRNKVVEHWGLDSTSRTSPGAIDGIIEISITNRSILADCQLSLFHPGIEKGIHHHRIHLLYTQEDFTSLAERASEFVITGKVPAKPTEETTYE